MEFYQKAGDIFCLFYQLVRPQKGGRSRGGFIIPHKNGFFEANHLQHVPVHVQEITPEKIVVSKRSSVEYVV